METKSKVELVIGGAELLTAIGVSTLVGGAVVLVRPSNIGVIRKVACSVGGLAIASMATDEVVAYVDKTARSTIDGFKGIFKKKEPETKDESEEITEE